MLDPPTNRQSHLGTRQQLAWGVFLLGMAVTISLLLPPCSVGRDFPPYRIPPGRAILDSGWVRGFPWVALLARSNGRPCVEAEMAAEGVELCEQPAPLAVATLVTRRDGQTRSVVALMGGRMVRHVYLNFDGRRDERVRLFPVSSQQARDSEFPRHLKVAAYARYGPFCLRRYAAYGSNGRLLFRSQAHSCDS